MSSKISTTITDYDHLCVHKIEKVHSVHSTAQEALARAAKDWFEDRGIISFFDV